LFSTSNVFVLYHTLSNKSTKRYAQLYPNYTAFKFHYSLRHYTEIILDLELIPYRYLSCCKSVTETGLNCVDPSMAFKNVRSCINNLFIFCDSFNVKVIA